MGCKSIIKAIASIFLALLLLTSPHFTKGAVGADDSDSEIVYDIDYKGPETHSSVPPPNHSGGHPLHHQEDSVKVPRSNVSRVTYATRRHRKKVRG